VIIKQDLKWAQQSAPSLEDLASAGYPRTWPASSGISRLPEDSHLPACSGEEFNPIRDALITYVSDYYRGIVFQTGNNSRNLLRFNALTSGEIATTTLQRAGRQYLIRLARVYYLSKNEGLRSVWLAYGYTDQVLWEQRQGVDPEYNRGFQLFRGDTVLWLPEEADKTMQIPGQELFVYLFGQHITSVSADLLQCPWGPAGLYVPDQVACSLALHEEYSAGAGSTDLFLQTETAPEGWYLINWSINLKGITAIPGQVCR
jgi:hypothetical protein